DGGRIAGGPAGALLGRQVPRPRRVGGSRPTGAHHTSLVRADAGGRPARPVLSLVGDRLHAVREAPRPAQEHAGRVRHGQAVDVEVRLPWRPELDRDHLRTDGAPDQAAVDLARRHSQLLRPRLSDQAGRAAGPLHDRLVRGLRAGDAPGAVRRVLRNGALDHARAGGGAGSVRLRALAGGRQHQPIHRRPRGTTARATGPDRRRSAGELARYRAGLRRGIPPGAATESGARRNRSRCAAGMPALPHAGRHATHRPDLGGPVSKPRPAHERRDGGGRRGLPDGVDDGSAGQDPRGVRAGHAQLPRPAVAGRDWRDDRAHQVAARRPRAHDTTGGGFAERGDSARRRHWARESTVPCAATALGAGPATNGAGARAGAATARSPAEPAAGGADSGRSSHGPPLRRPVQCRHRPRRRRRHPAPELDISGGQAMTAPAKAVEEPLHEPSYLQADSGIWSWLNTRDHKRIGVMFLVTVTGMFLLGGIFALALRTELLTPNRTIMDAMTYDRMFTLHGVTMVWLFLVPSIPTSFGNFLLPLQIGAKDLAFPKLNLMSFYTFVLGAVVTFAGMLAGGTDTGWTFYAPYADTTPTDLVPV